MKRIAFASLFAFGLAAGAAQAAHDDPGRVPGGGAVLGGGGAAITGGGDNATIVYSAGGAGAGAFAPAQHGRLARFAASHGDGPAVEYMAAAETAEPGREAWMVGGGDNAQVVYARPR